MKIKFPFISAYFKRKKENLIKSLSFDYLSAFDFELTYKAYKKYVLDVDKNIPEFIEFENYENPKISIIIPVFNQYELTLRCLNTIKKTKTPYEIILVDDCSSDKTCEIENYIKGIKVIRNKVNLGYLKNNNLAINYAKGEYIYLLNNDTYLFEGAIDELFYVLENDKTVGACGSKLIFPNGKLQSAGSKIYKNGYTFPRGYLENPLCEKFNQLTEVDFCCGASLMIRKNLYLKLGGFDELFLPAYYEETDLCKRITEAGFKVVYQPKSELIHYTSQSFGSVGDKLIKTNKKKFYKKWKGRL